MIKYCRFCACPILFITLARTAKVSSQIFTQLYLLRNCVTTVLSFFYVIQNIAAHQNKAGDIVISTQPAQQPQQQGAFNADSVLASNNLLLQQQQQQDVNINESGDNNNNNNSNNNNISQNIVHNNQNNDIDDNSGSESSSSDEDSSSDSSEDDSDSSSSGDDSESSDVDILRIPKKKKYLRGQKIKIKKSGNKTIKISKKDIRKALKKKNMNEKVSKAAHNRIKAALKQNPKWNYLSPVLANIHGLNSNGYWKKFAQINVTKTKYIPSQVIFEILLQRAKILPAKEIKTDIKYLVRLYQNMVAYNDVDCSTVFVAVINMVLKGNSFKQAYKATKMNFSNLRTVNSEAISGVPGKSNNNNNIRGVQNAATRTIYVKPCRDFNFNEAGCSRQRCRFSHACVWCGKKNHGLRRCREGNIPSMVIGQRPMGLPAR